MTYDELGIEIPFGKSTGQVYTTCPKCSQDRKKKKDKCLGVNLDKGIWHCTHCEWKGTIHKKQYALPKWENKTALPDSLLEWFQQRNVSQDTLIEMKVSFDTVFMPQDEARKGVMCFNYFRDGKFVNVKYRTRDKHFRLYKDAELIFYNLDGITGQKEIYITEGECDTLIMIQSGFKNTCSVPNGASKTNNRMEYLDNCFDSFTEAEKIFILTDQDEPGNTLADELARRLGVERCYRVSMEFKDVNDAVNAGEHITREWIDERSKPYPLVGVFEAGQFWDDLISIRMHGFPKGWKPRGELGTKITIHPGFQSVITGIPSHGKSEHLDQLLLELSIDHDLRGGYFSPENQPTEMHLLKMVEKITGQNFWDLKIEEINAVKNWITEHIFWAYPDDGFDLTNVLAHVRKAVLKFGINWYVIDPWNKLDHQFSGPETAYISRCLDELDNFNKKNKVHGFLVAHPTKMEKDKDGNFLVPNLYSISGSAHFFNKCALGWTVYKKGHGLSDVHIQKVKFKYWGEVGMISYVWEPRNGRYYTVNPDVSHWLKKNEPSPLLNFYEAKESFSDLPF